ncbi:MAG: endonuclease V [Thermoproteota archaeon]|nr:endonuclease V [Candidatus Brockarchaeota archaeon]MBO3802241.1 endonuclease V [Candidatus Brockarchaeota archaeon]
MNPRIRYENAARVQVILSKKVKIEPLNLPGESFLGGVDVAYKRNLGVAAYVLMKYGSKELESTDYATIGKLLPYIPGLFYLREAPPILKVLSRQTKKPHVLLINGHGLAHPRKMGLASYIGVVLDIPTIGVARNLLYGKVDRLTQPPLIFVDGLAVGAVLRTGRKGEIYISIGHKVTLDDAIRIISDNIFDLSLPAPLWYADKLSKEALALKNL